MSYLQIWYVLAVNFTMILSQMLAVVHLQTYLEHHAPYIHITSVLFSSHFTAKMALVVSVQSHLQPTYQIPNHWIPTKPAQIGAEEWQTRKKSWKQTGIVSLRDLSLLHLPSDTFASLSTARVADLSGNQLQALPTSITQLTTLHTLRLDRNSLSCQTLGPPSMPETSSVYDLISSANLPQHQTLCAAGSTPTAAESVSDSTAAGKEGDAVTVSASGPDSMLVTVERVADSAGGSGAEAVAMSVLLPLWELLSQLAALTTLSLERTCLSSVGPGVGALLRLRHLNLVSSAPRLCIV